MSRASHLLSRSRPLRMTPPLRTVSNEKEVIRMTTIAVDFNEAEADGRIPTLLEFADDPAEVKVGALVGITDLEEITGTARVVEIDGDLVWLTFDRRQLVFAS